MHGPWPIGTSWLHGSSPVTMCHNHNKTWCAPGFVNCDPIALAIKIESVVRLCKLGETMPLKPAHRMGSMRGEMPKGQDNPPARKTCSMSGHICYRQTHPLIEWILCAGETPKGQENPPAHKTRFISGRIDVGKSAMRRCILNYFCSISTTV